MEFASTTATGARMLVIVLVFAQATKAAAAINTMVGNRIAGACVLLEQIIVGSMYSISGTILDIGYWMDWNRCFFRARNRMERSNGSPAHQNKFYGKECCWTTASSEEGEHHGMECSLPKRKRRA